MTTSTGYTRINLTIPKDLITYLKRHTDNMSKYITEAVSERIARERRDRALREILSADPTFEDVTDGATYVREIRTVDTGMANNNPQFIPSEASPGGANMTYP